MSGLDVKFVCFSLQGISRSQRFTMSEKHPGITPSSQPSNQRALPPDLEKNAATEPPATHQSSTSAPTIPGLIDWKGPDDPELPVNWPQKRKWRNVLLVATLTFLTSVGPLLIAALLVSSRLTSTSQTIRVVNVRTSNRPSHGRNGNNQP